MKMKLTSDFKEKLSEGIRSCWTSPSNIALVKYWGKKGHQLPSNPSLSFSLHEAYTITRILATLNTEGQGPLVNFIFEGEKKESFAAKIVDFLKDLTPYFEYLPYVNLSIESGNNFPHSAGIASSASAMSALALSLLTIEQQLSQEQMDESALKQKASFIARLGSGSACRSVYGGYTVWGKTDEFEGSSDEYAIPAGIITGQLFNNIKDTILLVDLHEKKVSSRAGHSLMTGHPYANARYEQANANLSKIKLALMKNDWNLFTEVVENEALSLHAMMMSSKPGYLLMHPNTIRIVELIWQIREQNNLKVCFTIDAGPNIHLLYPDSESEKVIPLIEELKNYCYQGKYISDRIGKGPENKYCK